ncbi:GNAT family N-acetyltransferase [Janibacter sp. GS2]|uniref:GNAT family N-acetyltransferase n=1 Tax=Janibacter sp. GS2 TaxID=3442646 RepID=UPI003EB7EBCE
MTGPWSVRRLGEEDWQLHRSVRLAMLLDTPGAYGSSFGREVGFTETTWRERTGQPVFLAEREDGLPLGTATLLRPEPGTDAEIVAMWVAAHARGTGVADALVIACRDRAVAEGAGVVRLHVMLDNPRAVACYSRLGFVLDGTCGDVPGCSRMVATTHGIAPGR